jgi:hypothetical protein
VQLADLLWFHARWFFVAVVSCGVVGLWGFVAGLMRRPLSRPFSIARAGAIGAMLIQVGGGALLYSRGLRPGNAFHVFYGVVIAVTFALAYVYRAQLDRRPMLAYGLLLLFVMGLGLRAWSNVT